MSTALDDEPHVDSSPGVWRWRGMRAVIAGLIVLALIAAGAYVLLKPDATGDEMDKDPALSGHDLARAPVTTKTAVFRGTEAQEAREYEQWLGKKVDYIVDFPARGSWDEIANPAYMISQWKDSGFRPVYSIGLLPEDDKSATIAQGTTGAYDKYFTDLGNHLVAAGQGDAILRLGWEFNLESSRWSTSDPQQFIAYWRRVAAALRSVPGQQFEFDWNPNNGKNKYDAVDYYPGDDVVNYVGIDAYDVGYARATYPYPANCDQGCRLERQHNAWDRSVYGGTRGLKFWSRFAAHHGKPMSLPEWGLWMRDDGHGGGNDPYYLQQMHAFIANPANGVAYQSYFEFDGDDGTHRLMHEDFPGAGDTFRKLFAGS